MRGLRAAEASKQVGAGGMVWAIGVEAGDPIDQLEPRDRPPRLPSEQAIDDVPIVYEEASTAFGLS